MSAKILMLALVTVVGGAVLVTATTSHGVYSQEITLEPRSSLVVRDIRKNNIPFTSIWLRRNVELVQKDSAYSEEIIFRESLPSRDDISQPRLEMKSKTEVLIFVNEREPILVKLDETG